MSDREQTFPPQDGGGLPPFAVIASVLVVGAIIFIATRRGNSLASRVSGGSGVAGTARDAAQDVSRRGGSATRRAALTMLINAIESDATRRFVLIALRFARDRA